MINLNKRCFFVMSGITNELGKITAIEFSKKFMPGSVVVLFEDSQPDLARTKAAICSLQNQLNVVCCKVDWNLSSAEFFQNQFDDILKDLNRDDFELAFIIHNEGAISTDVISEPNDSESWLNHVQISLNATVGINQAFLNTFKDTDKLVVNLTPSAPIVPFVYEKLKCSAKKARDMYFRAMAAAEEKVTVLNYRPGFLESFEANSQIDPNNNINEVNSIKLTMKAKRPYVKPLETVHKLIDTLESSKFSSGHDIDFYTN
ncbi:sepiapterin reductase-like [Eupeodes corollae]|uniref:sepiapterin reductase-like n=1 Tax=Eupeodes corollae TaxID=290404 RepID=UPI00249396C6|nr:sepiapterin reductase-like [Eupeodes corollae]